MKNIIQVLGITLVPLLFSSAHAIAANNIIADCVSDKGELAVRAVVTKDADGSYYVMETVGSHSPTQVFVQEDHKPALSDDGRVNTWLGEGFTLQYFTSIKKDGSMIGILVDSEQNDGKAISVKCFQ